VLHIFELDAKAWKSGANVDSGAGVMEDVIDLYLGSVAKKANAKVFALHLDLGGAEGVEAACGDASASGAAPVGLKGGSSLQSEEERSSTNVCAWLELPWLPFYVTALPKYDSRSGHRASIKEAYAVLLYSF